jgi:hypothetical protein
MRDDKELNKLDMEKCLIAIEKRIRKKVESNRKQVVKRDKKPKMTPEEEKEAMEFLRSPAIWEITISDLGKIGHVGEEKNKLLLLLVFISRMLKKPLACLIRGGSSAGKNALVNAALEFVPAESKKIITRATANALYYYPPEELEHVALVVVEKAGGQDADYSVRTMISEGKLSLSVPIKNPATGIIETKDKEIKGPMSYVETSTDPNVNDENITRMFSIYIDESEDQTKRIHAAQKREKTLEGLLERHEKTDLIRKHQNAQRLLRNLEVIIPFATAIDFPSHSLRTRRDFEKLLYLIMTIGFYRQYQKEAKYCGSIPYIEADLEDYRLAYDLCQSVLNQTIDEVTKKSRELLGIIMKMLGEWQKEDRQVELYDDKTDNYLRNIIFKRSDVRAYAKGWSDATLYAHMKELSRYELLRVVQGGKQGQTYKYTLANESLDVKQPINKLLSPQELEIRLKAVSSEEVSQKT